jgi:cell division protein FtsW
MAAQVQKAERTTTGKANYDYILLVVVITLLLIGLMMVYSTTFSLIPDEPTYFFVRQLQWAAVGLALMAIFARIPHHWWRRVSVYMLVGVLLLLVAVLFIGSERFGAQRTFWKGSFQPSELAKLAIVIYIADWVSSKGNKIRHVTYGLIPFAILLGVLTGLILLQPDFGTAILIVSTASVMFFLAGADILQLLIGGAFGSLSLLFLVTRWPYAAERLAVFWQSINDPVTAGHYQIRQALVAFGQGGVLGRGLGESQLKFTFLPLSHTDSIFAVVGEELGLIGCLVVIGLFALLAYRGLRIALQSPDNFGMILAAGVTTWLVFESLINIAVVTATLPPTGIPLPFISYGGSALVSAMAGVGILLSVSRGVRGDGDAYADSHSRRGDSRPRLPKHSRRAGDDRRGEFGVQQTR